MFAEFAFDNLLLVIILYVNYPKTVANNIFFIRQADVSTVDFIKPREAQDQHDSTIPLDSHTEILVAIGSLRYQ